MGTLYLDKLVDWCRDAGLPAEWYEYASGLPALTASRRSGGYRKISAIQVHHDASNERSTIEWSAQYGYEVHHFAPVGCIRFDREPGGRCIVGAGGATNTSGKGGPLVTSQGTVPLNDGNPEFISIEALNNGKGEPWENDWLYARLVAAIIVGLRRDGAYDAATDSRHYVELMPNHPGDVHFHYEWRYPPAIGATPEELARMSTDKIDAAGPALYSIPPEVDRYQRWEARKFRAAVCWHYIDLLYPQAVQEDAQMLHPTARYRLVDGVTFKRGVAQLVRIPKVGDLTPKAANLKVHVIGADAAGRIEVFAQGVAPDGTNAGAFAHEWNSGPISIAAQPCDAEGDIRVRIMPDVAPDGETPIDDDVLVFIDVEGVHTDAPPEAVAA